VNRNPYSTEEQETAWRILRYLRKHPNAKDTTDGIARWWLQQESGDAARIQVERALAFLLGIGLIIETQRKGLPRYYGVNPAKLKEINEVLERS
jgi:hypothetical protein